MLLLVCIYFENWKLLIIMFEWLEWFFEILLFNYEVNYNIYYCMLIVIFFVDVGNLIEEVLFDVK